MSSGLGLPVIDLRSVSQSLATEAVDKTDLVVLEGMGRAIETNLNAAFKCDALKLGMIKHPEVREAARYSMLRACVYLLLGSGAACPGQARADAASPVTHAHCLLCRNTSRGYRVCLPIYHHFILHAATWQKRPAVTHGQTGRHADRHIECSCAHRPRLSARHTISTDHTCHIH